jgi:signal transduction histidine kinase
MKHDDFKSKIPFSRLNVLFAGLYLLAAGCSQQKRDSSIVVLKKILEPVECAISADPYHHAESALLGKILFQAPENLNDGDTIRYSGKSAWYRMTLPPHNDPIAINFFGFHTVNGFDGAFRPIARISAEFYRETERHQRHMAFQIPAEGQSKTYYFKTYAATIQRDDRPALQILRADTFDRALKNTWYEDRMIFVVILLVLGVGFFQILYIASLGWSRRKPEYWDYLGFIITAVIMVPISRRYEMGLGEVPWLVSSSNFSYFGILNLFYCRFVRNYLNTKQTNPVVYRQLKWAEYIIISCVVAHSVIYLATRDEDYTNQYYFATSVGYMGLNFYFLVLFLRQRSTLTNYLLAGAATMVLSGLGKYVYILFMELGFFSKSRYFDLITLVGGVVDSVILNLALNYKHRKENLERQMALENERNRIAKDLHDDIGTSMGAISLASFNALLSKDPVRIQQTLQEVVDQTNQLGEDMRDIVWSIRPENNSIEKIAVRMRQYAVRMLEEQGVELHFDVASDALPLTMQPNARKHLYLLFKESVHNIARHAYCTRADIRIRRENGFLLMHISDNGRGFDPENPAQTSGGNGLKNLHSRAKILGGILEIQTAPGQGTQVCLKAPAA